MNEQNRYRLTGAIFLLALASIVLPIIFDGSGVRVQQVEQIAVELPALPSSAELDALKINAEQTAQTRAEIDAARAPFDDDGYAVADGTRLGDPELREPSLSAQATPADRSTTADPLAAAGEASPPSGDWAVQLASFSNPANARAFRDRLNNDGHQAWLSERKQNGSLHTRVAIGPLDDKATAQRLVTKVSERYDVEAILVEMSP